MKRRKLPIAITVSILAAVLLAMFVLNKSRKTFSTNTLQIITTSNLDQLKLLDTWESATNTAYFLAVDETNQVLAASNFTNISLWNLATGGEVWNVDGEVPIITSLAFSPTENILASYSYLIMLRDTSNGAILRTMGDSSESFWSLAFASDGATLAAGSEDGSVFLWDVSTGELLTTFHTRQYARTNIPLDRISSLAYSPDNLTLAIGKVGGAISLLNVSTGEITRTFQDHTSSVNQLMFNEEGDKLASASNDYLVIIRNLENGESATLEHPDFVYSISFSGDEDMLASASQDGFIRIWDVEDQRILFSQRADDWVLRNVIFLDNQRLLISGGLLGIKFWGVPQDISLP